MNIAIIGFGVAGKHYLNILLKKKILKKFL